LLEDFKRKFQVQEITREIFEKNGKCLTSIPLAQTKFSAQLTFRHGVKNRQFVIHDKRFQVLVIT
jgi:hypothetical protein